MLLFSAVGIPALTALLRQPKAEGGEDVNCGADGQVSTLDNAISQCDAFGFQPSEAAQEVKAIIRVVNTWKDHFAQGGVSPADIQSLAERIDGEELLKQRTAFKPDRYRASVKRKRTSPFQRD